VAYVNSSIKNDDELTVDEQRVMTLTMNPTYSSVDAFGSAVSVDIYKSSMGDRTAVSTAELALPNNNQLTRSTNDLFEYSSTPPSIPAVTRVFTDP
ncbi:unnamed protein product, partial [Rotaria socialis]